MKTAEFERWIVTGRIGAEIERIARRLGRRFGLGAGLENYWDLQQEIVARAIEMFRNGQRPLDGQQTRWLRRLAYDAASKFAEEHRRARKIRSLQEPVVEEGRPSPLEAVVEDPKARFTRDYIRRRGAEFLATEIDALPPIYQQAFLLVEVEGKPLKEAAAIAKVPYRTMVSRHQAAIRMLARRLAHHLDDMTREPV
jgi:DNA-directed RNA polymerase specialized sigma24 family protein